MSENTLDELWRRSPTSFATPEEYTAAITAQIEKYRANRTLWASGAKAVKEPKVKEPKGKGPKVSKVSMADLEKLI